MIDLIISQKTIAIIFEVRECLPGQHGLWKIAFGTDQKKILPKGFRTPELAAKEARRLGFGGYRIISKSSVKLHTRTRRSMKSILLRDVTFRTKPVMYEDEKNWRAIYTMRHANTT
jgi:hypothetical protein